MTTNTQATPKLGNPAVVGLGGFGLTTLLLQLHNLGLATLGPVLWVGIFFGGLAQLYAGLQEQKCGNNFGYAAFSGYGAFWLSLCGIFIGNSYGFFKCSAQDVGMFLSVYTLFTLILWGASLRISKAMAFTFTTLLAGFVMLDFEKFGFGSETLNVAASVDLIVCALGALYMLAHVVYLDVYKRDIFPVGKPIV